jgi:hypothetical protein
MTRLTVTGEFDLDKTITATYFTLRWAIVGIAVAFPPLLWIGGCWVYKVGLQNSLSAYYATGMRDWFVGVLFSVAACLFAYKGLSDREDYLLNGAAIFAVLTAVNPFCWRPSWWFLGKDVSPHDVFAVTFFVMIALACWLCQDDSLNLGLAPPERQRAYRLKYTTIGIALVAFPILAVLLNAGVLRRPFGSSVFWVEAAAIWVFAFYWYTKSGELRDAISAQIRRRRAREIERPDGIPDRRAE